MNSFTQGYIQGLVLFKKQEFTYSKLYSRFDNSKVIFKIMFNDLKRIEF